MIVKNNQCDGSAQHGCLEHLARMNKGRGGGADRDHRMCDRLVTPIEVEGKEVLAGLVANYSSCEIDGLVGPSDGRLDLEAPSPVLNNGFSDKSRTKVRSAFRG